MDDKVLSDAQQAAEADWQEHLHLMNVCQPDECPVCDYDATMSVKS